MALIVGIEKKKTSTEKWVTYEDGVEFKIRGINHPEYQIAIERRNNYIFQQGFDLDNITPDIKTGTELLIKAGAYLIADWKGVQFTEDNGEPKDVPCSYENAVKLLTMGDIGVVIWAFVQGEAEKIQKEADAYKNELLGKSEKPTNGKAQTQRKSKTKSQNESDEQT